MLTFSDAQKTVIQNCTCYAYEINDLSDTVRNGHKLDTKLIRDDDTPTFPDYCFQELLSLWIEPYLPQIQKYTDNTIDLKKLFIADADKAAQADFWDAFTCFIRPNVHANCPVDGIKAALDRELAAAPAYLRLRVLVICVFLNMFPEDVFEQGANWYTDFLPNEAEPQFLNVQDNDSFVLCFDGITQLTPRILYNPSNNLCALTVRYGEEDYRVNLPPQGGLHALFADKACKQLVCVKGGISANPTNDHNAIVQVIRGKKSLLYLCHSRYEQPVPYGGLGYFLDAAANSTGGAVVLRPADLYYPGKNRELVESPLPIRVYGAGQYWAMQYADGHIRSNLKTKDGSPVRQAWAIVENGNRSMLFLDKDGAWECSAVGTEKLEAEEFVKRMLAIFPPSPSDRCEQMELSTMKISILNTGELKLEASK